MTAIIRHWPDPTTGKLIEQSQPDIGPGTPLGIKRSGGMSVAAASQRPDVTIRRERQCPRCGTVFVVTGHGAHARVWCSDACRMAARKEGKRGRR